MKSLTNKIALSMVALVVMYSVASRVRQENTVRAFGTNKGDADVSLPLNADKTHWLRNGQRKTM